MEIIDVGCENLVNWFNDNGLKTKFSCEGHDVDTFYIQFDDLVSDSDMETFILEYTNRFNHSMFSGKFSKWARVMSGNLKYNWRYEAYSLKGANNDYQKISKL